MCLLSQLELLQLLIYVSKLRFLSSGTNIDGSLLCELKGIMCSRHESITGAWEKYYGMSRQGKNQYYQEVIMGSRSRPRPEVGDGDWPLWWCSGERLNRHLEPRIVCMSFSLPWAWTTSQSSQAIHWEEGGLSDLSRCDFGSSRNWIRLSNLMRAIYTLYWWGNSGAEGRNLGNKGV